VYVYVNVCMFFSRVHMQLCICICICIISTCINLCMHVFSLSYMMKMKERISINLFSVVFLICLI